MSEKDLKIFVVEKNPYSHPSDEWFEKINSEDIIDLKLNEYYLLENSFNLWESINEELSEESGYMGGPTIWEDTWINDSEELIRIKEKIESIIEAINSDSNEGIELLTQIIYLTNKAFKKKWWLVFDF